MDIDDLYKLNPNNDAECYARGKKKVMIIAGIFAGMYAISFLANINIFSFYPSRFFFSAIIFILHHKNQNGEMKSRFEIEYTLNNFNVCTKIEETLE